MVRQQLTRLPNIAVQSLCLCRSISALLCDWGTVDGGDDGGGASPSAAIAARVTDGPSSRIAPRIVVEISRAPLLGVMDCENVSLSHNLSWRDAYGIDVSA